MGRPIHNNPAPCQRGSAGRPWDLSPTQTLLRSAVENRGGHRRKDPGRPARLQLGLGAGQPRAPRLRRVSVSLLSRNKEVPRGCPRGAVSFWKETLK